MKKINLTFIIVLTAVQFCLAQWTSPTSGKTITNDNVGIGTSSPTSLLTIGSPANRGTFELVGSTSFPAAMGLTDSRSGAHQYTFYNGLSSLGNFDIFDQTAGAYRFTLTGDGKFGLNILTPQATLDVARTTLAGPILRLTTPYDGVQALAFSVAQTATGKGYYALDLGNNLAGWQNLVIPNGKVGIGTLAPDALLAVKGSIHAQEVKIDMVGWSDYVFDPGYSLLSLSAVKNYIDKNKHLPEIPSEQEVKDKGINIGEMLKLQTKKIEELTLYLIQKDEELKSQQSALQSLQQQIDQLKSK